MENSQPPRHLLTRSLKVCYFPSSSIWDTKIGTNSSYAWRGIWGSRSLLDIVVRWRVGDGKTVRICKDAWLGIEGSGKLITTIRVLDENATVETFMDKDNLVWRDVMKEILLPMDVDRIMQIPISSSGGNDERIWAVCEDGIFRVHDAYNLALRANEGASSSNGRDSLWQKMWKLHIPPKAKIFLWRTAWDILPHGTNLSKKGIINVEKCQRCGMAENNSHVLKDCYWVRDQNKIRVPHLFS